MTADDRRAFAQAFNRMAVAFPARFKDDDTNGSKLIAAQQVYWDALVDLPVEGIVNGAASLIRTNTFFPAPAEWITASKLAHKRAEWKALMPSPGEIEARREWKHECNTCQDSGWEVVPCKPGARCNRRICARADKQSANELEALERVAKAEGRELTSEEIPRPYEHNYAVRCFCIHTNRTYQRQWKAQFGKPEAGAA